MLAPRPSTSAAWYPSGPTVTGTRAAHPPRSRVPAGRRVAGVAARRRSHSRMSVRARRTLGAPAPRPVSGGQGPTFMLRWTPRERSNAPCILFAAIVNLQCSHPVLHSKTSINTSRPIFSVYMRFKPLPGENCLQSVFAICNCNRASAIGQPSICNCSRTSAIAAEHLICNCSRTSAIAAEHLICNCSRASAIVTENAHAHVQFE